MDVLAVALGVSALVVTHYSLYVVAADKYGMFLYKKGLLKRCKESVPMEQGRKGWGLLMENWAIAFITLSPVIYYAVRNLYPHLHDLDLSFKPLHTWFWLCAIYFCFDGWYYFAHRFVHENPTLYRAIHKRHHEHTPVDTYSTGRAHIIENVLFTTPGVFLWELAYFSLAGPKFNAWEIVIPVLSLLNDFALVHVGYYDTMLLYAINPFSYFMQLTIGVRSMCARHEIHHNTITRNYGPMWPFFDRLFGTAKPVEVKDWSITYESEKKRRE